MTEDRKPREWWILKGDSNFCDEPIYDIDTGKEIKHRPDSFYDFISHKDSIEGGIHVREVLPEQSPKPWYGKILFRDEGVDTYAECETEAEAKNFVNGFLHAKELLEIEDSECTLEDYWTAVDQLKPEDE